jgi:hypothetical protein
MATTPKNTLKTIYIHIYIYIYIYTYIYIYLSNPNNISNSFSIFPKKYWNLSQNIGYTKGHLVIPSALGSAGDANAIRRNADAAGRERMARASGCRSPNMGDFAQKTWRFL